MSQELIPAIVTPIKDGRIDISAYKNFLEYLKKGGIKKVLALGSTGEGVGLFPSDFKQVAELVKESGLECVLCIANPNAYKVLEIMERAEADAYMLTSPFTAKARQKDIVEYYRFISEKSGKPLFIYNNIARFGYNITFESYQEIFANCKIVGVKECAGVSDDIWKKLKDLQKDYSFKLYAGDDDNWMNLDVDGSISVIANIIPEIGCELAIGNKTRLDIWNKYCEIFKIGLNPANVKYLLSKRQLMNSDTWLSFVSINSDEQALLDKNDIMF